MHQPELETRRKLLKRRFVQQTSQVHLTKNRVWRVDIDAAFVSELDGCGCRHFLIAFDVPVVNISNLGGCESGKREQHLSHCLRTRLEFSQRRFVQNVYIWMGKH